MPVYTEAQLVAQARALLNESTALFWSDTELADWVKQGTVDVSTKGRCVETAIAFPLTALIHAYAKPAGLIGIETIHGPGGTALAQLRGRQFGHVSSSTEPTPTSFCLYAGLIIFHPVPQVPVLTSVLYWIKTDNVAVLDEGYQNLVLLYVMMKARLKEQRYNEAAQLHSMYLNELQFQRQDLQEREPDSKEKLRLADRITRNG